MGYANPDAVTQIAVGLSACTFSCDYQWRYGKLAIPKAFDMTPSEAVGFSVGYIVVY